MHKVFKLIILMIIYVVICFSYGFYRCSNPKYKDIFEKRINIADLDGWSMIHFIQFFVIGLFFPQLSIMIIAFILGVSWELFEFWYAKTKPGWLGKLGDCKGLESDKLSSGNWWYGRWTDVLMNFLGLLVGYLFASFIKLYKNKKNSKKYYDFNASIS